MLVIGFLRNIDGGGDADMICRLDILLVTADRSNLFFGAGPTVFSKTSSSVPTKCAFG